MRFLCFKSSWHGFLSFLFLSDRSRASAVVSHLPQGCFLLHHRSRLLVEKISRDQQLYKYPNQPIWSQQSCIGQNPWDHIFPILMVDVNITWICWSVSAQFQALHCCHMNERTGVKVFLMKCSVRVREFELRHLYSSQKLVSYKSHLLKCLLDCTFLAFSPNSLPSVPHLSFCHVFYNPAHKRIYTALVFNVNEQSHETLCKE